MDPWERLCLAVGQTTVVAAAIFVALLVIYVVGRGLARRGEAFADEEPTRPYAPRELDQALARDAEVAS